jgi:hypothetical protein
MTTSKSDKPCPGCTHPLYAHNGEGGRCTYTDPIPFEHMTLGSVPCKCTHTETEVKPEPQVKVTKLDDHPFQIEDKRFYLPFKIEAVCPYCSKTCTMDLSRDYLSYPYIGKPEPVHFAHETSDPTAKYGAHEWTIEVVLGITLEPWKVEPPAGDAR